MLDAPALNKRKFKGWFGNRSQIHFATGTETAFPAIFNSTFPRNGFSCFGPFTEALEAFSISGYRAL